MSGVTVNTDSGASQGSLWRRWDPHLHLPGTLLNDQFKGMTITEALGALSNVSPCIEVIGVTDYYSTASFRRARAALDTGVAPTIRLAFPNVELRLDNATSSNHGVNVHLLCPPDQVEELDQFIGGLEFSWAESRYRADRSGLIRLGRDHSQDPHLDEEAALKAGVTQFKVNFEDLRRALRTDKWAMKNVLVAIAGGERDGSSGVRDTSGSFVARRQSIEALADIVFSGNPNQFLFWTGEGGLSEEELESVYGGMKLCLHGSDAHDPSKLGAPDLDRFSWLKGDPTFDTLRLACLAPRTRAYIGTEPPDNAETYGRITRVSVPSTEWFANESLPLNTGLVAIIGARGSGKTALADLIASGAGSTEPFGNRSSFIYRAGQLLDDSVASVEWSHGEITTCDFADPILSESFLRPVRYLSQQFVERLCASDGVSDDLLAEIERVIFGSWPVDQRQGATSFRGFLETRLTSVKERQSTEKEEVLSLSERITQIRLRNRALPKMEEELKEWKKKLEDLEREIVKLTDKADRTSAERLGIVSESLRRRRESLHGLELQKTNLEGLQSATRSAQATTFPGYLERLQDKYNQAGLTDEEWEAFAVNFTGDVDGILDKASKSTAAKIKNLNGSEIENPDKVILDTLSPEELLKRPINELKADTERLQKKVGLDEVRGKNHKKLTDTEGQTRTKIDKREDEIQRIKSENSEELYARRLEHYAAYFGALLDEESELREMYAPLGEVLQKFGPSVAKLRFVVRRTVDLEAWTKQGEALLDLRKEGRFRGEGELSRVAQETLVPAWQNGDAQEAASAIGKFVTSHSEDLRNQRLSRGDNPKVVGEWERSIALWLYGTDHISLRYHLEYEGLSIERLSPGMRGIVLLLLYLAVDQEESDPLIIDQPEENLDPESVYSELVRLFRSASERRQIIMVTHNANLVVNTDVDQVIVAHCGSLTEGRLPEMHYVAGGLEDPEIRSLVCEVLEGGAEAFRQRAKRLGLDLSVTAWPDTPPSEVRASIGDKPT